MTPNRSAIQETLNGSPAAPLPNGVDSGISFSTQSDNIRRATPEFQKQVNLEVRVIDTNVQLKVKNAIVEKMLSPKHDDDGTIFLGAFPDIEDSYLLEDVVTPQLKKWQSEKLEISADLIGKRIPRTKKQLTTKQELLESKQQELDLIEKEALKEKPNPYIIGQLPSVLRSIKGATNAVNDLPVDVENYTLRAHSAEAVFVHLRDILADEFALESRYKNVLSEAKLDAYFEVIEALERKKATIDDSEPENLGHIHDLAIKIRTLRAELKAMMDVAGHDVSAVEVEAEPTYSKPVLTKMLGYLGIKSSPKNELIAS